MNAPHEQKLSYFIRNLKVLSFSIWLKPAEHHVMLNASRSHDFHISKFAALVV